MRINKLLSNYGYCSRKEANQWIEAGRITVDGLPCIKGQWVEEEQVICVDGQLAVLKPRLYLKYHKPVGVLSTMDGQSHSIDKVLNLADYVFPVGRLDKDSEGLLFLTNDGDLANQMIAKDNHCEKVYEVTVNRDLEIGFLEKMASGVLLGTERTLPCLVRPLGERQFEITLKQGMNRQIRRMATALGYRVERLVRRSFGSVSLDQLPLGQWEPLSDEALKDLKQYLSI